MFSLQVAVDIPTHNLCSNKWINHILYQVLKAIVDSFSKYDNFLGQYSKKHQVKDNETELIFVLIRKEKSNFDVQSYS